MIAFRGEEMQRGEKCWLWEAFGDARCDRANSGCGEYSFAF